MLLDTHVLAWSLLDPDKLSPPAREALIASSNRAVSAASLYEMSFKAGLGKWEDIAPFVAIDMTVNLEEQGFEVLPATGQIMQMAGRFDWAHRDPFDRLIVASAIVHNMDLISADGSLDSCPNPRWLRIW